MTLISQLERLESKKSPIRAYHANACQDTKTVVEKLVVERYPKLRYQKFNQWSFMFCMRVARIGLTLSCWRLPIKSIALASMSR